MSLLTDFKARFPGIPTAEADLYVPILEPVWPSYYNKAYASSQEAVLNLVAHLLVLESGAGSAGVHAASSKSVGSVSESYAVPTPTGAGSLADFNTTKYGQRFLWLIRSDFGGVAI